MTSRKASNWVDRGEPPVPQVQRTLTFFFDRHDVADEVWLCEAAQTIVGMVDADASDVMVAGYLKYLAREHGIEFPPRARLASVAVWHIAKAALVRDTAVRLLNSDLVQQPEHALPPLSVWLAERLLSPDELAQLGDSQEDKRNDAAP